MFKPPFHHLAAWAPRVAAGLCCVLTPAVAAAQTTTLFPETVVSASRVPVDRQKVGSAVSVLNQQDLQRSGTSFLSKILRDLPSMSVSRSGTFGSFTEVRLRGSESNHVLVLLDGECTLQSEPGRGSIVSFQIPVQQA